MLANIIPGLRDARTPLICGYVWVTAVWLFLQEFSSRLAHTLSPIYQDVSEFLGFFGSGAVVGLLSVLAYLTGTILQIDSQARIVAAGGGVTRSIEKNLLNFTVRHTQEAILTAREGPIQIAKDRP